MSTRTKQNHLSKPGVSSVNKPDRFTRKVSHKQIRRKTHVALSQLVEPDNMVLPKHVHSSVDVDPADKPSRKPVQRKRFKVWKTKAWKRRSTIRSNKAIRWQNVS